jgi:2-polyprenyl-3-methyl-5-hydroxy-6-metoxy-1,4-benzoquinol methylase
VQVADENNCEKPLSILVAVASYGSTNDAHLQQLLREYRSMPFDVDVVVFSNIEKHLGPDVQCVVGLPSKNPWSLPFAHKKLFAERIDRYDLFIYSEDDVLITERNIRALIRVNSDLRDDEIVGFLRIEKGLDGSLNYPEIHGHFHWTSTSARLRGKYTLAHFTNEHAACYVLTRYQLAKAIESGGFLISPHEGKYDMLCSAATDPYTRCGFEKLIPISHIDEFSVHHLPNKYVNKLGVNSQELQTQITVLLEIAHGEHKPVPLFNTETRLLHSVFSKDYYEPVNDEVLSIIPKEATRILSIGSAAAACERRLVERGNQVTSLPLDPIIGRTPSKFGVEAVFGDFPAAKSAIGAQKFDCLLYINVLQFISDPAELLCLFADLLSPAGTVIISAPNQPYLRYLWRSAKGKNAFGQWRDFKTAGIHNTSIGKVRNWCAKSGLTVEKVLKVLPDRGNRFAFMPWIMAPDFIAVARKA